MTKAAPSPPKTSDRAVICEKTRPSVTEAAWLKPRWLPATSPMLLIKTYSTLARSTLFLPNTSCQLVVTPHMKMARTYSKVIITIPMIKARGKVRSGLSTESITPAIVSNPPYAKRA